MKKDDLVWRNEKRRIGDLIPWEKNPRRLTKKQAEDLKSSINRFSYVDPVIVNADGRSIIGGHQRVKILLSKLGNDAEIDVRIPSRELSPREREELAIRLNRNTGEWDFEILANEFSTEDLFSWGFSPEDFGMGEEPKKGKEKDTDDGVCPKCGRPY